MSQQQVLVPDIGGAEGAEVIEILVAVGDAVALDQGLIVLESDKASMEIPSTVAGTVVQLLVKEGDQLAEGAPIASIEVAGADAPASEPVEEVVAAEINGQQGEESTSPRPGAKDVVDAAADAEPASRPAPSASVPASPAPAETADTPPKTAASAAATGTAATTVYAGPAVRKLAREFGISLQQVTGTGPQQRILKEDLQAYVQRNLGSSSKGPGAGAGLPVVTEVDFSQFGEVEVTTRSKLDKLTAASMQRSWLNVPHVTQFDEADITDLEEFRTGLKAEAERRATRLTPLPFLLKACALALREHPKLNSSLASGGEELVYKRYVHIGMAVDTPAGLVVPVLRDVDRKSIWELAQEVVAMADKARERKLTPGDMQGGCFTISSLGAIGGNGFTPIVNTPEVGILGVSRAATKGVWDGAAFVPRKLLPLSLSYDHRVVNGGDGGRFLSRVVELLGDIRHLGM